MTSAGGVFERRFRACPRWAPAELGQRGRICMRIEDVLRVSWPSTRGCDDVGTINRVANMPDACTGFNHRQVVGVVRDFLNHLRDVTSGSAVATYVRSHSSQRSRQSPMAPVGGIAAIGRSFDARQSTSVLQTGSFPVVHRKRRRQFRRLHSKTKFAPKVLLSCCLIE